MPDLSQFLPIAPTHWLTILHYLILLSCFGLLAAGGEKSSIPFLLMIAISAAAVALNLYINFFSLTRLQIFFVRLVIFAGPLLLVGFSPNEQSRGLAVFAAIFGFVILAMSLGPGCLVGLPIADPRSLILCN